MDGLIVIGGALREGLLRGEVRLVGQLAEVVMALGDVLPDPPVGAGLVVGVAVVVVAVDLDFDGLKIR